MNSEDRYDVVILGSGIAGGILAAILARNGVKTLLIEQGVHPRFAIGESTVPETTFLFRLLAARYGVPEIENLSTYYKLRRNVTTTCGVKRNFTFAHHQRGATFRPSECCQLSTLAPPLGPDMHMFRQDVDAYLLSVAAAYGAEVRQRTEVTEVVITDAVRMRTRQGQSIVCEFVVDAGGVKAPLAQMFGLREEPSPLSTQSRCMYTHMQGVTPFDACIEGRAQHGLPSPLSQGTLHHIFEGGWLWMIHFDNHPNSTNRLCSVGLTLDPRQHPPSGQPPEQEFRAFVARFPSIARQFENARAIRDWTYAERLQFSSTRCAGDRYCLVPHAFAFVDPLFSSGLTMSMAAINMLASRLLDAKRDGDYSLARFAPIDERMKRNVRYFDRLVSSSYVAFSNFKLWNAWYRVWATGTLYGALGMLEPLGHYLRTGDARAFEACERPPYSGAQASELPEYMALFSAAAQEIDAVGAGQSSPEQASRRIFDLLKHSGLWPQSWGALEPDVRHPGLSTLPAMLPLLRWMKERAPERIRKQYFVHFGVPEMLALVGREWADELRHAVGSLGLLGRDYVRGYNWDWRTPARKVDARGSARAQNIGPGTPALEQDDEQAEPVLQASRRSRPPSRTSRFRHP